MPPKDNITLGPGTMYFNIPEGLQPLGEVQEIEFTEEAETFAEDQELIIKKMGGTVSLTEEDLDVTGALKTLNDFTATIETWWNEVRKVLQPMLDRVAKDPRTPRLLHLARHGKNRRIRKKNAKRLCKIMKGE